MSNQRPHDQDEHPLGADATAPIRVTRWVDHRRRQSALTAGESVPIPSSPAATATAFTVLVDTREQTPWTFDGCGMPTRRATLNAGDYGAELHDGRRLPVLVERKSLPDLYGSIGGGRERLAAEFERAKAEGFSYLALIVEAHFSELAERPRFTRMNPAAILGTLESWSLRYGLHVWTPGPPESCWRLAYNIFRHAARQVEAGELQALPAA